MMGAAAAINVQHHFFPSHDGASLKVGGTCSTPFCGFGIEICSGPYVRLLGMLLSRKVQVINPLREVLHKMMLHLLLQAILPKLICLLNETKVVYSPEGISCDKADKTLHPMTCSPEFPPADS
jgi:hypothetical protein